MRSEDAIRAVAWIQSEYGACKVGAAFDRKDQWIAASFQDPADSQVIVIRLAQGKKEARLLREPPEVRIDVRPVRSLAEFKKGFRGLLEKAE